MQFELPDMSGAEPALHCPFNGSGCKTYLWVLLLTRLPTPLKQTKPEANRDKYNVISIHTCILDMCEENLAATILGLSL